MSKDNSRMRRRQKLQVALKNRKANLLAYQDGDLSKASKKRKSESPEKKRLELTQAAEADIAKITERLKTL